VPIVSDSLTTLTVLVCISQLPIPDLFWGKKNKQWQLFSPHISIVVWCPHLAFYPSSSL